MILRKPYAFFIKYFRLINLIIAILMGILIYQTGKIAKFFSDYIKDYIIATNNFILNDYINIYSFILTLLIIILTIIILSVIIIKQKPKKLYILNLILYIGIIILYAVDYQIMRQLGEAILDVRTSKAVRDITYIALAIQTLSFILTIIRATGFDIKSFGFLSDLQKLDIDTKDSEEFEVAVEFDKNKINRKIRKNLRNINYTYQEKKYIINLSIIIILIIIAFLIYINKAIYTATYSQNQTFQASQTTTNIKASYTTQSQTKTKTLVIIKLNLKSNITDKTLNTGLITLQIGKKSYSQTTKYNQTITDIGTPYIDQTLTQEGQNYLLTFEIPTTEKTKKMQIKYNDNISYIKGEIGAKNIYIKLKPQDLTKETQTTTKKLGQKLSFKDSILENTDITIKNIKIENKFKIQYTFCATKENCYKSYEYITPTATGNYIKTLMKIDAQYNLDENTNIQDIQNIHYFLNKYATISYKINDKWYSQKINSKLVKPKIANDNYYYIEINKEIKNATEIYLTFNIRNYTYKYILK